MGNSVSHLFSEKAPPSRQVETKCGSLLGKRIIHDGDEQVDAFLGIPYAKPPIGNLRFSKPQPMDPWEGVRHADKFGPRGVQKDMLFFMKWKYGHTSEDNLYLNVFTPVWDPPADGFPVMVFVHGGAFVSDSAVKYGDIGICKYLVPHGVVVVTIQYRLGYLGFFTTGDSSCVDNLGLWDMTAALQWINDNIEAFAGNKNNITLFGQSAGGASVDLLSLSPHSRDLFHKVIPMAGNAACEWAINENAVEACRLIAAKMGIESQESEEFIAMLRKQDAMKFATSMKVDPKSSTTEVGPRIDGDFLPRPPSELRTEAAMKPVLIGNCQYEGLIFSAFDKQNASFAHLEELIARQISESTFPDFKSLRSEALRLYIDPNTDRSNKHAIQVAITNVYSDMFLNNGAYKFVQERIAAGSTNTYLYSFDYFNPKSWGILGYTLPFKGATHCTELAYLFNVGIIMNFAFTDEDYRMLAIMTKLWSNFAKYGNPNGEGEDEKKLPFQWEPVSKEHPERYLSINLQSEMKDSYYNGRPRFWYDLRKRSSAQKAT